MPNSFRLVNRRDIVPRLPRATNTARVIEYEHVGRTVMLAEDASNKRLWVQRRQQDACPLADLSPEFLFDVSPAAAKVASLLANASTSATSVWSTGMSTAEEILNNINNTLLQVVSLLALRISLTLANDSV